MIAKVKAVIKDESGMSLIEIVAAVAFSVITLGALITLGIVSSRSSDQARKRSQAIEIAKEGMEAVRAIRDNISEFQGQEFAVCGYNCACSNWDWVLNTVCPWGNGPSNNTYFLGKSNDKWNFQYVNDGGSDLHANYQLTSPNDSFYRKIIVSEGPQGDGSDKQIEIRVSWKVRDRTYSVSEETILTDWR